MHDKIGFLPLRASSLYGSGVISKNVDIWWSGISEKISEVSIINWKSLHSSTCKQNRAIDSVLYLSILIL